MTYIIDEIEVSLLMQKERFEKYILSDKPINQANTMFAS